MASKKNSSSNKKVPKGHHIWPYSGDIHPVGEKHRVTGKLAKDLGVRDGTEIHGDETDSIEFLYQKEDLKEGK